LFIDGKFYPDRLIFFGMGFQTFKWNDALLLSKFSEKSLKFWKVMGCLAKVQQNRTFYA